MFQPIDFLNFVTKRGELLPKMYPFMGGPLDFSSFNVKRGGYAGQCFDHWICENYVIRRGGHAAHFSLKNCLALGNSLIKRGGTCLIEKVSIVECLGSK